MSTPQIIRDPDDLNTHDEETLLLDDTGDFLTVGHLAGLLHDHPQLGTCLPAVVIATGDQVRAARKALQGEA